MKKIWKIILVSVFCFIFLFFASWYVVSKLAPPESRPNIILISIETTRADHLSCYGYKRKTTPTIDKLAEEGILFENMFAPRGQTWPSLTSMMTSLYPANHGVRDNGHMLSPSIISLAEILKDNGYTCGAFLGNAFMAKWRGFDHKIKRKDTKLTQQGIEWVKKNSKRKIFFWIHFYRPHNVYRLPKPYASIFDPHYAGEMNGSRKQLLKITRERIKLNEADLNHIISLYDGCILFIDDQIKQLLAALKDLGIEENSLIIVTADHGEDLYQRHFRFDHRNSIYDSSLHIPFIIKMPDKTKKNVRVKEMVEKIDIAPTILELVNISIPDYFEGQSVTPLIFGKGGSENFSYAYSEWRSKILSIRTDRYRYIFNPRRRSPRDTYPVEKEELYDIIKDPRELNNIATASPDIAQSLMKKLLAWDNFKAWMKYDEKKDKNIPEDVKERLRSLGYL